MPFTSVFGGQNIYPANLTLLNLAMTTNVTLSWPVEQAIAGADVFADIIRVTPDPALTLTMPDARQAAPGQSTLVDNIGANTLTVNDNAGNPIGSVPSGEVWQFYLADNSTQAGTWRTFQFGTGVSSATAAALAGAGLKAITTTLNVRIVPETQAATPYAVVDADRAKIKEWTGGVGTFNLLAPATAGSDWFFYVRNSGTGDLTVTTPSGYINASGTLSVTVAAGASALIICTGTYYVTLFESQGVAGAFDYLAVAIGGTGNYTLSGTELNRVAYRFTGALTGNRTVIVPNTIQQYWVDNQTSGAFTLTVKTAAGLGVVVPQGLSRVLYSNGTDVVAANTQHVPLLVSEGGTGLATVAQGDLLYASATDTLAALAKDITATRYLSNTGASNNPAWAQVDLTNGVLNRLPFANLTQGSALSVLGVAGGVGADVASIVAAADGNVLRRSGSTVGFGQIDLSDGTNAVVNILDETNGGTGQSSFTQGDMLYASAANVLSKLAKATGLKALLNTGATNNPAWDYIHYQLSNAITADFTLALTDSWAILYHTDATVRTATIPTNASVAFDIGTAILFDNVTGANNLQISPDVGVTLDGHGVSYAGGGNFVVAPGYKAYLIKRNTNTWFVISDTPVASGQGVLYAGFCDGSAGASVTIKANSVASGWSVSRTALGLFRVTHSLGLSAVTDLAVVANIRISAGGTDDRGAEITNENANYFEVNTFDNGAGANVDEDFYFHATRLV